MIPEKRKLRTVAGDRMKKVRINWKSIFFWAVFLVFWGTIIYIFLFSGRLAVADIQISGTKNIDRDMIAEDIRREISGKYLDIIPKDNLMLMDKARIAEKLRRDFKKIESIETRKKFPSSFLVKIGEHDPSILLCVSDHCFSIDKKGIIYDEAKIDVPARGEEDLPIIRDMSSDDYHINDNAVTVEYADFISHLRERIKSNLEIDLDREFETPNIVSDDIRAKASQGFTILFSRSVGMEKSIDELRAVIGPKIEREKMADLEYIDLRIDNKIYYKFKGDNGQENSEEVKPEDSQGEVQGEADKKSDTKKKKKK